MKLHLRDTYGMSLAIWDHTDSVTCYPTQVNTARLIRSQTSRYSIYLPRRDGRLSWRRWPITYRDVRYIWVVKWVTTANISLNVIRYSRDSLLLSTGKDAPCKYVGIRKYFDL